MNKAIKGINKTIKGVNDLESQRPDLLKYWDYEINSKKGLFPDKISVCSKLKVYWLCEKCGRSFERTVSKRTSRSGICDVCLGRTIVKGVNDLATTHSELVEYWDFEKNADIDIYSIGKSYSKKVWWKCKKCGRSYEQVIASRIKSTGNCGVCTGKAVVDGVNDLATTHPDVLEYWDYKKNDKLGILPTNISYGASKDVYWICKKCGSSYSQGVTERVGRGTGICPTCYNRKVVAGVNDICTTHPELLQYWDYEENDKLGIYLNEVYATSPKEVSWFCVDCGRRFVLPIAQRTRVGVRGLCKACKGKEIIKGVNDFPTLYPELLNYWDFEKNKVSPYSVGIGTHKKYWWVCKTCNRSYEQSPIARRSGTGNCLVCVNKEVAEGFNDLATKRPDLIPYWNVEENRKIGLEITNVSEKSNKDAHWYCTECNEDYISKICNRTKDSTQGLCPSCIERKLDISTSNFSTYHPELLEFWDYEKNNEIGVGPTQIRVSYDGLVWWKCVECGESYQQVISGRIKGTGKCYSCRLNTSLVLGQNDLKSVRPNLLQYWDYEKNSKIGLSPEKVTVGSEKRANWFCIKCGRSYEQSVANRTICKGYCPVCSGTGIITGVNDLAAVRPDLLEFWDYEKNSEIGLDPTKVSATITKKAWWICGECGESYFQSIGKRVNKKAICPVCNHREVKEGVNDIATTHPEHLKEWDYEKNDALGLYPTKLSYASNKKVYWKCPNGHSYLQLVCSHINRNHGCPECGQAKMTSYSEQFVYLVFSDLFQSVHNRLKIDGVELDVYIEDLILGIEYDGIFHEDDDAKARELRKNKKLKEMKIDLIRVKETRSHNVGHIEQHDKIFYYHNTKNNKVNNKYLNKVIFLIVDYLNFKYDLSLEYCPMDLSDMNIRVLERLKQYTVERSFASLYPDDLKDWDYEKNGKINPYAIYPNSEMVVWWKCHICGKSWESRVDAKIQRRTQGCIECGRKHKLRKPHKK